MERCYSFKGRIATFFYYGFDKTRNLDPVVSQMSVVTLVMSSSLGFDLFKYAFPSGFPHKKTVYLYVIYMYIYMCVCVCIVCVCV